MNNVRRLCLAGLIVPASLMSACSADLTKPQAPLPVASACFITSEKTVPVTLELAESFTQRQKGLMARTTLDANAGMLFIYHQTRNADHGFWMYNTLLPLDIAYLNSEGVISNIQSMAPCTSTHAGNCPVYPAGVEFIQAVEMNQGFFANNQVTIGDQLAIGKTDCPVN